MNALNRRDFLKLAGLVLASGALLPAYRTMEKDVPLVTDPQIRFAGKLIRGTSQGVIFSSSDEGMTWKELIKLGDAHAVLQLVEKDKQIYANLSIGAHDFWLRSTDAQKWFTV